MRISRKATQVQDAVKQRQAEVDAAWALYQTPQHKLRREWLEQHMQTQKGRCAYCNVLMRDGHGSTGSELQATIDHVVPRSRGGADVRENTLAACAACNLAKANLDLADYKAHPVRLQRLAAANTPPDRLSADPRSPFHDTPSLDRGVGVRFRGAERDDVEEYCLSEGWVRIPAGNAKDRRGRPVTVKLRGPVDAWFTDLRKVEQRP